MLDIKKQARLNNIIHNIYDTTIDSQALQQLLQSLADQFGALMASYLDQNPQSGKAINLGTIGLDSKEISRYTTYYGPRSMFFKDLTGHKQGDVFIDQMMVDYDSYLKSETYNDFQLKHDFSHGMSLITQSEQNNYRYIILRRSKKLGFYDNNEFEIASILLPHLIQANKIAQRLELNTTLIKSFEKAFNHLSAGVALVNTNQEVVFINQSAESIICRADGINIVRDKLSARDPNDNAMLKAAIQKAFALNDKTSLDAGNTCTINRKRQAYPYQLLIMPIAESCLPTSHHDALALVMIHDPNTRKLTNEELIAQLYGLTLTEARVAQSMCNQLSTSEIASLHNISENGVRYHTKNIYQKLHIKRQTDLVSLILNGPLSIILHK